MKITERALDARERERGVRRAQPRTAPVYRGPSVRPVLALALILLGAGAVLAPAPVPWWGHALGLAGAAVGGYLLGAPVADGGADRRSLAAKDAQLTGLLVQLASLGIADQRLARRGGGPAERPAPEEPRAAMGPAGRVGQTDGAPALRTIPGGAGETLRADADSDDAAGGLP